MAITLGQLLLAAGPAVLERAGIDATPQVLEMPDGPLVVALHMFAKVEIPMAIQQSVKGDSALMISVAEHALNELVSKVKGLVHP